MWMSRVKSSEAWFSTALIELYQLGYAGTKGTQNPWPQLNLT